MNEDIILLGRAKASPTLVCSIEILSVSIYMYTSIKKQLQKIERKVGMEYQKAYKQG